MNENTTTKETPMSTITPERIAEEVAEARSRVHSDGPYATREQHAIVALADALESALARNANLEARAREVERAVVPEIPRPSVDEICRIWNESRQDGDVVDGILEWARSHVQSIPSSRVLGEGIVEVNLLYLNALILVCGILFEHMATDGGIPMTDALAGAMERIEAHEDATEGER